MRARVLNFCRFESEGIVSLASTCRIFFNGLLSVVRQAKKLSRAIVEWPSCGAVVELTWNLDVGHGLFNGARCIVSKVSCDVLEVHLLGPVRKLMTSPVTLPRACFRPDMNVRQKPPRRCRLSFPRPHPIYSRLVGLHGRQRDRARWAHTAHSRPTGMDVFL